MARLAYFEQQNIDGWCHMRAAQPWAHWLIEVKQNLASADDPEAVYRPISNNNLPREWGDTYYWRPAVFGCSPNKECPTEEDDDIILDDF